MKKSGSFKKNTFWLIVMHVYSLVVGLIVGPLTARSLGPLNYGNLVYAENVVVIFATLFTLGMDNYIIAELVQNPDREPETLGTAMGLRLIGGVIGAVLSMAVILDLKPDSKVIQLCCLLQSTQIILSAYTVFSYWIQAHMISQYLSLATMAAMTIASIWKVLLAVFKPDVYLFSLTNSIRNAVYLAVMILIFWHLNPGVHLKYDHRLARYFLSRSWQFVLAGVGQIMYTRIDQLMVGSMINSESLAYYNVAVNLMNYWNTIPNAFVTSAQPVVLANKGKDEKKYISQLQTTMLGILLLSVIAFLGALLLARPFIVTLYSSAYAESAILFNILMISSAFSQFDAVRMIWIIGDKHEKYYKYFIYAGAITDIVMNYFMIKAWGTVGAALATVLAQFVVFFVSPLFFKETRPSVSLFLTCWKEFPSLMYIIRNSVHSFTNKLKRKR